MLGRHVLGVVTVCFLLPFAVGAAGCSGNDGDGDGDAECDADADCNGEQTCDDGECVDAQASASGSQGNGASGPASSGAGSAPGTGGCADAGESCAGASCCAGNSCVDFDEGDYCAANCVQGSDCKSGCCAGLEGGGAVCAPVEYCGSTPLLPVGVACNSDAECASNDCIGWCTQACSTSSDCGPSGACVTNSADQNICFPSCTSTEHCSTFADTTCQSGTSVDGVSVQVCSI